MRYIVQAHFSQPIHFQVQTVYANGDQMAHYVIYQATQHTLFNAITGNQSAENALMVLFSVSESKAVFDLQLPNGEQWQRDQDR